MARLNLVAANKIPQKEIKARAPKAPRPVVVTPSNDDQKDHFITKNGLSYAGSHVIIDLWEAKGLDDREKIETALIDTTNNNRPSSRCCRGLGPACCNAKRNN